MSNTPEVVTDFPRVVREIEHQIIVMQDGCKLSARIWLPDDATDKPVAAIVEHLPYRKRDGTIVRDCLSLPWFAGHGYACIRVDMRGNGDSEGLMDDEYTATELDDACSVIAWAASQSWCNGSVGMMGISWGGFNALQVASLRPPALKAIITLCSTVDRFADDIHFKGGCLLGENLGWAANMLSYSSRPPDPLLVGDAWKTMWLNRLENMPFLANTWIGKQQRDAYWKHGSVCENYGAINAAVLSIGGWHDGYRNTISHLVENIEAPVKGIVGPWIHKYPHYAGPAPQIGFLQEAKRWWDHWLNGVDTGVDKDPAYRAYVMDSVKPARWLDERPGRWIAEQQWPSPTIQARKFKAHTNANGDQLLVAEDPLSKTHSSNQTANQTTNHGQLAVAIQSDTHCGAQAGEFFPFMFGPELPDEQSPDDALSVCFDTQPVDDSIDIVGAPQLKLNCAADKPLAFLAVRLCDLRPDGTSALITLGIINLTHANGSEQPTTLIPGELINASLALDQIAYRLPARHRLRLAFSTNYWPLLWPSPEKVSITLNEATLSLPIRPDSAQQDIPVEFAPAQTATPWAHEAIRPSSSTRKVHTDKTSGVVSTHIDNDFGENRDLDHQLRTGSKVSECWSIHPEDPLSANCKVAWEQTLARENWIVNTSATVNMHCDEHNFYITGKLIANFNGQEVFNRDYDSTITRNYV